MDWLQRLTASGLVTAAQVAAVTTAVQSGQSYEAALLGAGVPPDVIRQTLAAFFGVPVYTVGEQDTIAENVLAYLPEESAKYYRAVPLRVVDGVLLIATSNPENLELHQALNFISTKHNLPHKFVYMLDQDVEKLLAIYASLSGEVGAALGSLESELDDEVKERAEEAKQATKTTAEHLKEDAPVTKIVATILRYAVDGKASDIHVEPTGTKVVVRFRVDGLLQKSLELPQNVQSPVIARIKILSSMRLDEKRKPQDGRFSATFDGRRIDFRVSILPTNHGEKAVMRILDTEKGVRTLEETGISPYHLEIIRRVVKEPYGIILISGPTGSGKSTTLYGMLAEIDRLTKNVLSLEDPVEYDIEHVSQSQVRPEIGYTFAAGLRSALRQDPDIIMVGEIRDKETAQLAIQAALTGHLVLSTIHTNNAIGVIPRLIDMGVDPYLIAPTLKLAMAQRLARRLCPGTGQPMVVEGAVKMMMDTEFATLPPRFHDRIVKSQTVMHPVPSPGCTSGTKGRVAVMEVLEVNDAIQELILKGGSEEQMYNVARSHGFMTMKEDAINKALSHIIPYEEVSAFGTNLIEEEAPIEAAPAAAPVAAVDPVAESMTSPAPVDNQTVHDFGAV
jgi:type IV pilus assembly protein PilB